MTQQEPLFSVSKPINILKTLRNTKNHVSKITAEDLACKDCEIINVCKSGCRLVTDERIRMSIYHDTYATLFDEFVDLIADLQWKYSKRAS